MSWGKGMILCLGVFGTVAWTIFIFVFLAGVLFVALGTASVGVKILLTYCTLIFGVTLVFFACNIATAKREAERQCGERGEERDRVDNFLENFWGIP